MAMDIHESSDEPINTYLDRSIFAFFVFWPLGIVALVYSIMARSSVRRGERARAADYAALAVAWGMAALCAFVVVLIGIFVAPMLFPRLF
ncbi:MAG: CD225/dispanin family protein [Planctomycetes bacterium]|nr:CD225/dispanin family protein [Planctomycetota bacterium]